MKVLSITILNLVTISLRFSCNKVNTHLEIFRTDVSLLSGLVGRALFPSVEGRVKSKTEKLAPAASLVSVH